MFGVGGGAGGVGGGCVWGGWGVGWGVCVWGGGGGFHYVFGRGVCRRGWLRAKRWSKARPPPGYQNEGYGHGALPLTVCVSTLCRAVPAGRYLPASPSKRRPAWTAPPPLSPAPPLLPLLWYTRVRAGMEAYGTSYGNQYGKSVDMMDMCAQLLEAGGEVPPSLHDADGSDVAKAGGAGSAGARLHLHSMWREWQAGSLGSGANGKGHKGRSRVCVLYGGVFCMCGCWACVAASCVDARSRCQRQQRLQQAVRSSAAEGAAATANSSGQHRAAAQL